MIELPAPVWPGLAGALVLLAMTHGMLAGLGPGPLDPLFRIDLGLGLAPVVLDPIVRFLADQDPLVVRALATLTGFVGIALAGLALRPALGLRTLSLCLFLLGAWAWTRPDPYALASFGHWLRLAMLGLTALLLSSDRTPSLPLLAGVGVVRGALCGEEGLLVDALALWIMLTTVEEARSRRPDRGRLLSLGAWVLAVFAFVRLGPRSGLAVIPPGIEGFEDTNYDFPPIQLGGPAVLLLGMAVFAYAAPRGLLSRGRTFVAVTALGLCLVLVGMELSGHRQTLVAQARLLEQDSRALGEVLGGLPTEGHVVLVDPPLHLRPELAERLLPGGLDRVSVLTTWDFGGQVALPPAKDGEDAPPVLRWLVSGPVLQTWHELRATDPFPRAALLAARGTRFPLVPAERLERGSLSVPLLGDSALEVLADRYRDEGRDVAQPEDLPEAEPRGVDVVARPVDGGLEVDVGTAAATSFLVALAIDEVRLRPFPTGPALLYPQSYEGRPDFLSYYAFLSGVYKDLAARDLYTIEEGDGLTVQALSWLRGYGPVFHVVADAAGKTRFLVRRR
ncbi:MAG: hypothetical protein R3F30_05980 [Planctomycetota bacterium]